MNHVTKRICLFVLWFALGIHTGFFHGTARQAVASDSDSTLIATARRFAQASGKTPDIGASPTHEDQTGVSSGRKKPEAQPESTTTQEKDKNKPFREFVPSEKIEADNAVDFPVDI